MKRTFNLLSTLVAFLFLATSCSTYDRVAVWYKYRNDFRVQPVKTEHLASKGKAANQTGSVSEKVTTAAQEGAYTSDEVVAIQEEAYASKDPVAIQAVETTPEAIAMAKALVAMPSAKANIEPTVTAESAAGELPVKQSLKTKKETAKAMAPQKAQGSKSLIVAALLAFFFGVLGVHRFYLGYTKQGLLQLFTGGGFGIWWFIDFIRILMGNLKPKDGDYS